MISMVNDEVKHEILKSQIIPKVSDEISTFTWLYYSSLYIECLFISDKFITFEHQKKIGFISQLHSIKFSLHG